MSLAKEFREHVDAGFSGVWVTTDEIDDAQNTILGVCNRNRWLCIHWSLARGIVGLDPLTSQNPLNIENKPTSVLRSVQQIATDALKAQRDILQQDANTQNDLTRAITHDRQKLVLILPHFHLKTFVESAEVTQLLSFVTPIGRLPHGRFVIVILAPTSKISPEYEKLFVTLKHQLPNDAELTQIAKKCDPESKIVAPAVRAARGLTRVEAENAFSLSLVRNQPFDPQLIWDIKAQMIEKSGLMTIYRGTDTADNMAGLDHFFDYSMSLLEGYDGSNTLLMPRGLLLLGVPGSGKSQAAKCLANKAKRPLLMLDMGRLMGGLVGETEANTRRALAIADAMAPCILFVDELEKALAGSSSGGGRSDTGVGMRLLGSLLTWLNDHTTDVFFLGTCNKAEDLPAALTRAERFDAKFFFDLPKAKALAQIWMIYFRVFSLTPPTSDPNSVRAFSELLQKSAGWTGAEIRSCCRLAAIQKRSPCDVAETIVPVSRMYREDIASVRAWASDNCLAADKPGKYARPLDEASGAYVLAAAETLMGKTAAAEVVAPRVNGEQRVIKKGKSKKGKLKLRK